MTRKSDFEFAMVKAVFDEKNNGAVGFSSPDDIKIKETQIFLRGHLALQISIDFEYANQVGN